MAEPGKVPSVAPEAIVERFRGRLVVFAARRLQDPGEAEDAAQETLRRVIVALDEGRIRDPGSLPGFVFETARHICQQRARKTFRGDRALSRLALEPPPDPAGGDPLGRLIDLERRDEVRSALGQLATTDRRLLELFFRDDLDVAVIAMRLQLSAGAVRVRKHRALRRLGEILGQGSVTPAADREPQP